MLSSLSLPSVEYLYMSGVHFLNSPYGVGNWPEGDAATGLKEDFAAARQRLIDDLHADIGIPAADQALRQLSHWVVWPLYGWQQNDGQEYNMMTLVDQIAFKQTVPLATGVAYLRALLKSQAVHLRHLAARTLAVLGVSPADPLEKNLYHQAFHASDYQLALPAMVRFRWLIAGHDPQAQYDDAFAVQATQEWSHMLTQAPNEAYWQLPIFSDPLYNTFGGMDAQRTAERQQIAQELCRRYPNDWFAGVAYAQTLLQGAERGKGEQLLKAAIRTAPDPVGHFTLGSHYVAQGMLEQANALWMDVVQRWPWNHQGVGNVMWYLTRAMTCAP
jgi:hypothetical protein